MSLVSYLDAVKTNSSMKLVFVLVMSLFLSACGVGAGEEDALNNASDVDSQTPTEEEDQNPVEVSAVQISAHPQSLTIEEGDNAFFTTSASGGGALSFQWRKDEQNIVGATGSSLVLVNVSEADAALYDVVVSNSAGSQYSLAALLSVNTPVIVVPTVDPVVIVSQPQALTVDENTSASFSVQVTGDGEISYQWLKDGQTINGATAASFSINPVSLSDAASYRVRVTNSVSSVLSNSVVLSVTALPEPVVIVSQPQALTVDENTSASFSVQVTGDGEISYQWLKDGQTINGATSASFSINPVSVSDAASYRVRVTNSEGSVLSNSVALTVIALPEPVVIVSQPQALTVDENTSASFSVQVTGDGEISYQWLKDGQTINGATSASFSINPVSVSDAASYRVRVTNSEGSVLSNSVALTVTALPEPVVIVSQPQALTVDENTSASFSVQATGDGEISYQWLKDGQTINGATSASFSINPVSVSDAASYRVRVTNSEGSVLSNSVALTVIALPEPVVIVSQPQALTVDENTSASFSVQATGDGEISYQWLKDGQTINGATAASFSINPVSLGDAASYRVRVTNSEGSVLSNSVALTVTALPEPVVIVSQPQALTVDENTSASFSVQVTGDGEISYQWLKDGQAITGATSANFSINPVSLGDAASYRVRVTNSEGSVLSSSVALTVIALPEPVVIITQPQSITVDENASAGFSVEVIGDGEISYQWLKDGGIIEGEDLSTLSLSSVTSSDAASYSVIVTGSDGPVLSDVANLVVTVVQVVSSIELTWDIPEAREDGSDLSLGEINGYVIVYGTDINNLANELVVEGASNTSTQLLDLASGTYYFAIATVDSDGVQGAYSGVIQQSI